MRSIFNLSHLKTSSKFIFIVCSDFSLSVVIGTLFLAISYSPPQSGFRYSSIRFHSLLIPPFQKHVNVSLVLGDYQEIHVDCGK